MMSWRQILIACAFLLLTSFAATAAPSVDPELKSRLRTAQATELLGVVLTFQGETVSDQQMATVSALGIKTGVRFANFPIMGVNATPAQIQQLLAWDSLRSVYLNTPLQLYLHQTKPLIGIDRLREDTELVARNGGQPVAGQGITIAINDTGIDGTHADVSYNQLNPSAGKTIQNVLMNMNDKDGLVVRSDTLGNPLEGILPPTYVENLINSDTNGGHGTHVASIAAGTGAASNGLYQGVAPGAKLLGLGSGAGLFIIGQIAAFDYCFTHQFEYNIRVVNNSWGNSAAMLDPNHPINVASKRLHDKANIVVVFAAGNDGPDPNSQNRWASWPWVISVGAAQKDGRLASFSSRGIFGSQIRPTILTPGTGGPSDKGYTSDVIAARSRLNPAANGLDADAQIPPAFLANYTQISGTSMAAPHLAGIVATILSANPKLTPDAVKAVLERTATPLGTYDEFEDGAGMANVHAAVDLAFNPSKPYGNFGFTGKGFSVSRQDAPTIQGSIAPRATTTHTINVPDNARFAFIQLDWGASVGEDEVVIDNTNIVINDLNLAVLRNGQTIATSNGLNLGGLFGAREAIKLEFPAAGSYTVRVSAGLSGAGVVSTQPYTISLRSYTFDPNTVNDIASLDATTRTNALRLVYDRIMSADAGAFRPDAILTRMELGRALVFGARVPQFIPSQPSFLDLATGSPEALIAESLRREGVMGVDGSSFGASAEVSRLEEAVALVRGLRLDAKAVSLAGTDVKSGGQVLTDNSQIPAELRGYVQLALDSGLLEAYPAEIKQVSPGFFMAVPGPRFEPSRTVTRAEFVRPATRLVSLMFGE